LGGPTRSSEIEKRIVFSPSPSTGSPSSSWTTGEGGREGGRGGGREGGGMMEPEGRRGKVEGGRRGSERLSRGSTWPNGIRTSVESKPSLPRSLPLSLPYQAKQASRIAACAPRRSPSRSRRRG
jgi:hypothetical protein